MTGMETIYRSHAESVYRFAYWLCGDGHEAEDIVSETFIRAWGGLENPAVGTIKAYLFTIARNVFLARRKRNARYTALPERVAAPSLPPDAPAERRDQVRAVMAAMQELNESDRAALLMRVQHDLSYQEIARSLGISIAAAKVRVHRARLRLNRLCETKGAS